MAITMSHEDIVAEYQRRLTVVTHENVMLGLALQQAQQRIAALGNAQQPDPCAVPPLPEAAEV